MNHLPVENKFAIAQPEAPVTVRRRKRRKAAPPADVQRPALETKGQQEREVRNDD